MRRYEAAEWRGRATTYGPLPDGHPKSKVRFVFHTTETAVDVFDRPGPAQVAGHFQYVAATRTMIQDADLDRRVGTLISSRATGVDANELSVQIEIIAFSDRALARERGGIWVGDFTDDHYQDLADLLRFVGTVYPSVLDRCYGPSVDFPTWTYGRNAPQRMSAAEWLEFSGTTAHGAVPGNTHWDSGALDLHRIYQLATVTEDETVINSYNNADPGTFNEDVQFIQQVLASKQIQAWDGRVFYGGEIDGLKGAETDMAMAGFEAHIGRPNPNAKMGGNTWFELRRRLVNPPPVEPHEPAPAPDTDMIDKLRAQFERQSADLIAAETRIDALTDKLGVIAGLAEAISTEAGT